MVVTDNGKVTSDHFGLLMELFLNGLTHLCLDAWLCSKSGFDLVLTFKD